MPIGSIRKFPAAHYAGTMLDRAARNFSAQLVTLGIGLLDRFLITGLLVHLWGADRFGGWALLLSFAGLAQLFDGGLNIFYGNEYQRMAAIGDRAGIARLMRVALFVALAQGAALVAALIVAMVLLPLDGESEFALLLLGLVSIANVMRGSVSQLYRAHSAFARGTLVATAAGLGTVLAGFATFWLSGGMAMLAALHLLSQLLLGWGLMLGDLRRRHPDIAFHPARPTRGEIVAVVHGIKWLAPQQMAPVIWLQAPVVLLGAFGMTGVPLASFILMRTLVGLSRQIATMLSNSGGVELAGSHYRGEEAGAQTGVRSVSRLVSVLAAASGAALIVFGDTLIRLWTGSGALFDVVTMTWLVLGALAAAPSGPLASLMMYTGKARSVTVALAVQGFVGLCVAGALMPLHGVSGVAAGLAVGEICGLGLLLPCLAGQNPWRALITTIVGAGWCLASALIVKEALSPTTGLDLAFSLVVWSLIGPLPLFNVCRPIDLPSLNARILRSTRRGAVRSASETARS